MELLHIKEKKRKYLWSQVKGMSFTLCSSGYVIIYLHAQFMNLFDFYRALLFLTGAEGGGGEEGAGTIAET